MDLTGSRWRVGTQDEAGAAGAGEAVGRGDAPVGVGAGAGRGSRWWRRRRRRPPRWRCAAGRDAGPPRAAEVDAGVAADLGLGRETGAHLAAGGEDALLGPRGRGRRVEGDEAVVLGALCGRVARGDVPDGSGGGSRR
ncbi:hypothetical protein Sgou_48930 [Streptomyces gougerotii]|uniref:Uncharacterized protein n=1 Tax=Streptomyces gougerotii TaxID=53448 RepID=A0A8H9LLF4_9ACTN|nr:hypothetical protein Sgou_48930 [Streptomyces gougerotii]GGU77728.1 hypothetical protein GCM10010227_34900 [Streptomyces gougerotii]